MTYGVDCHEQARAARVVAHMRDSGRRRYDGSACRRGQVDASVYMAGGTQRIKRLQLERRAAERLGDHRASDDRAEWKPRLAGDSRRGKRPRHADGTRDRRRTQQKAHHSARTTECSACVRFELSIDSSLCATFSALPIAPGTLNTTSSAARANTWRSGTAPVFSSAKLIAIKKSWIGCMMRLVTKSFRHIFARYPVSGSTNSRPARGAEIASTMRTV